MYMGKIVNFSHRLFADEHRCLTLYVKPSQSVVDASVSIGMTLADALLKTAPHKRSTELGNILNKVLAVLSDDVIVRDIDVLFNPVYSVDVLRILEVAYRKKPYSIIWPGECLNGELTYSEYDYDDYKEYNIANYDILCVLTKGIYK